MRVENFGWCLLLTKTCSHWLVGSKTLNFSDRYIRVHTQNEAFFKEVTEDVTVFFTFLNNIVPMPTMSSYVAVAGKPSGDSVCIFGLTPQEIRYLQVRPFQKFKRKSVLPTNHLREKLEIISASSTQIRILHIHFLRRPRNRNKNTFF